MELSRQVGYMIQEHLTVRRRRDVSSGRITCRCSAVGEPAVGHVNPDEPVIRARERERTNEREERIAAQRPKHSGVTDLERLAGEHVVGSKVAGRAPER